MGLLDDSLQQYYQGNDFGNYQFTSLDDIITQFQIAYVGEDKIISKVKRSDIAFHAQRALQELSFDTFKSCKAQEIVVPASLQMILPHDYVNYTKISWSDSAGIKHPLYPISNTSNPTNITQGADGNYVFPIGFELGTNMGFDYAIATEWVMSSPRSWNYDNTQATASADDSIGVVSGALTFTHHLEIGHANNESYVYNTWQEIDVTGVPFIELSAEGLSQATDTNIVGGTLRIGITGVSPNDYNPPEFYNSPTNSTYGPTSPVTSSTPFYSSYNASAVTSPDLSLTPWLQTLAGDEGYLEWTNGENSLKTLAVADAVDVSGYDKIYVVITSRSTFTGLAVSTPLTPASGAFLTTINSLVGVNSIDAISVVNTGVSGTLSSSTVGDSSLTWNNYKANTPSANQNNYQDDVYWPLDGSRYGLDPGQANANGSYFIDCTLGKIHFSSNIAGKTVILDYISDSLGTDGEMQVHKFAEEAMYKWIAHAILATRANTQEYLVNRFKKERFAAVRTAKLRLSNIKLEELTQILRGKSKQIKH